MMRVLGFVVFAVLGFYVLWPAYSVFTIKNALESENVSLLSAKIDFDSLRQSLRPAVTTEVEKAATAAIAARGGGNAALFNQLKDKAMPTVVDTALTAVVTPESLIRIHREGRDLRETIKAIVTEKLGSVGGLGALAGILGGNSGGGGAGDLLGSIGNVGGLFGKRPTASDPSPAPAVAPDAGPAMAANEAKPKVGLANIKSFGLSGPLGYAIGIAKDPGGTIPDATIEIAFSGWDWRLVGVRPRT
jgi:hypothetical protein